MYVGHTTILYSESTMADISSREMYPSELMSYSLKLPILMWRSKTLCCYCCLMWVNRLFPCQITIGMRVVLNYSFYSFSNITVVNLYACLATAITLLNSFMHEIFKSCLREARK